MNLFKVKLTAHCCKQARGGSAGDGRGLISPNIWNCLVLIKVVGMNVIILY